MIKTHHAILDSICQFETETERVLSTAFVKTMEIKTATLTFNPDARNENHEVDIHIMTSEQELEKLARRRDIKLHVPPQKDDHTEPKHVQQDYLINTLQASKHYSSLLKYSDYIEANHDILNLLNKDWKLSPHYPHACMQSLIGSVPVEGRQTLHINHVELYDIHHERFSGYNYSNNILPTLSSIYSLKLNITSRSQDNSTYIPFTPQGSRMA